jgi:hypothetical protein
LTGLKANIKLNKIGKPFVIVVPAVDGGTQTLDCLEKEWVKMADAQGNVIRHPFSADWPLETLSTNGTFDQFAPYLASRQ